MVEFRKMAEISPEDYAEMGFRSGLEIHQQLRTVKKLFCRCPVLPYSQVYNAEILRHMRPTLSELGEYDGTALMEFKTKKEIIYQIQQDTVCTYEMDDTPPFELNEEALDIALEITMLLGCNLVSEVHIARKQYLDGSIPTGFQRTTILGVDGWIPYRGRRIGITQLGLEEDACREVSDVGHVRTYRTDRLGIPLVETVTYPHMRTPVEVEEVAQIIRWLTRSTGKVQRGIGATRQDVNVSIEGGRRVEIKGVPRIPLIPLLVHTEAFRQLALLGIREELQRRRITPSSFMADTYGVTDILRDTQYYPVAKALGRNLEVRAVVLRGYRGILPTKTQPETTFAKEISDRVRVIACLDRLPNIAHSDMEGETFSSLEWTRIKKHTRTGDGDVVVIVWGNNPDVDTASNEIAIRAREALDGIPNETRQALPDGTTGFERILPGPDRMYPDTDLPPLAITEERIQRIRSILPEPPWEREQRYRGMGLSAELAKQMSIAQEKNLFDELADKTALRPVLLASLLLGGVRSLQRKGKLPNLNGPSLLATLQEAASRRLPDDALLALVELTCGEKAAAPREAAAGFERVDRQTAEQAIGRMLSQLDPPAIPHDKLKRYLMGRAMEWARGRIEGSAVSAIIDAAIRETERTKRKSRPRSG